MKRKYAKCKGSLEPESVILFCAEVIKGGGSIAMVAIRHVGGQLEGACVRVVWRSLENPSTSAVCLHEDAKQQYESKVAGTGIWRNFG